MPLTSIPIPLLFDDPKLSDPCSNVMSKLSPVSVPTLDQSEPSIKLLSPDCTISKSKFAPLCVILILFPVIVLFCAVVTDVL